MTAAGPVRRSTRPGTGLVRRQLLDDEPFGLLVESTAAGLDLRAWLAESAAAVHADLLRYGAVLFRGFVVDSPAEFAAAARKISPELLGYLERAAVRTEVADKVFTSTEFAADQWIPLHHEMSYSHNWPGRLYFYCAVAAERGGATPLASERRVGPLIPTEVWDRFARTGVLYVRNYGPGLDLPWQQAFQTTDRAEVEAYCAAARTELRWTGPDTLRTVSRRPALATHPETGETVWFNHAHLFHVSNLPPEVAATLMSELGPDGLPRNAFHGDGSPIEEEVPALIRTLYRRCAVQPPWQEGDVLVVDNILATHGRAPFSGDRRILVAMSDLRAPGGTPAKVDR